MEEKKEMCTMIPLGSCPNCGHKKFIVDEISHSRYLTNRDGCIIDHKDISTNAVGICLKCYSKFIMMETCYGYIPMSKIRSILFDFTPHKSISIPTFLKEIKNPMEK